MQTAENLKMAVKAALDYLSQLSDIAEVEIFAASNSQRVLRFNYSSLINSNGLEEPKSKENYGIGIQAVFRTPEGNKIGFGSEANNLSLEGVKSALEKARQGAVADPEFQTLPKPLNLNRFLYDYHDPKMMELDEEAFVNAGWKILDGAVETFGESTEPFKIGQKKKLISSLGLIVGGDLTVIAERIAIASTSLPEAQTDESTIATVFLTAMVEELGAKGSGYGYYRRLSEIDSGAGKEAARAALNACGVLRDGNIQEPASIGSGSYTVIFGPQPVSELVNNLILPGLTTGAFYQSSSPFMGKMGELIASEEINLYDDATNPEYPGAKAITCEGIPTKETPLIVKGRLTDLLSNHYETWRLLLSPEETAKKLGQDPHKLFYEENKLLPTSGFRFDRGGGRSYESTPGIAGTNIVLEGTNPRPLEELLREIDFGLYVGRIWYCYPINGLRAGDFTATVVADSYIIKDGKVFAPLKANAIRINDNILRLLKAVASASSRKKTTILWAADEIPVACDLLVTKVTVEEIGKDSVSE